jgi:Protein of unknown function (DUF1203).
VDFRIVGLEPSQFRPLFNLPDEQLAARNIHAVVADDSRPGFPCRIRLDHARPGERLLLLNHEHLPAPSPYRSAHAIYVGEESTAAFDKINTVPEPVRQRIVSVRAFDARHMMVDAGITNGESVEELIGQYLQRPTTTYLHIHYAMRGCYAARVERA